MSTVSKGRKAEDIAKKYLVSKGYKFIKSNFFVKGGELDLVMHDPEMGMIVFIEVKSLKESPDWSIYETLTRKKKKNLKTAINKWLLEYKKINAPWRVDFIGIIFGRNQSEELNHFKFIEL